MKKSFNNSMVYDFLAEECKQIPDLWDEFGKGIISHTTNIDFWEQLGERLDCFRICDECGRPVIEGYIVDGCDVYCSDECLHNHLSEEEFTILCGNGNGNTYWTTWYEESITYQNTKSKI